MSKSIPLRAHEAAAYAAGRLTQIRRVLKGSTEFAGPYNPAHLEAYKGHDGWSKICPYGSPGDTLALREGCRITFPEDEDGGPLITPPVWYIADGPCPADVNGAYGKVKPATQMPLWAVRWHPVITAVRLERVQSASNIDFQRLGLVDESYENPNDAWDQFYFRYEVPYRKQFTRDNPRTPWESNPWCWVLDINNKNCPVYGRGDKA